MPPQEMRTVLYLGLLFCMVHVGFYNVLRSNELGVHLGLTVFRVSRNGRFCGEDLHLQSDWQRSREKRAFSHLLGLCLACRARGNSKKLTSSEDFKFSNHGEGLLMYHC